LKSNWNLLKDISFSLGLACGLLSPFLLLLRDKDIANENNRWAAALIQAYRQQGLSWLANACKLNEAGFKTSREGEFQAVQVQRIYERISD
jgi:hypothetical protein